MTNEELAIRIKAGETDLMSELWAQVEKFVHKMAHEFMVLYSDNCSRAGLEYDDLYQAGYLALGPAIRAFTVEEKYTFLTYFGRHIKNIYYREIKLYNSRGKWHNRGDMLNRARSLEEPIGESYKGEGKKLIADLVPDEDAEKRFNDVENQSERKQLRADLDEAIASLAPQDAQIIRDYYFNDLCDTVIGESRNLPRMRVNTIRHSALEKLRQHKSLKKYREQIMGRAYSASSLGAFKNTGSSSTERIVMWLESYAEEHNIKY